MTNPAKYRKKPVVIDAMQWDGSDISAKEIQDWAIASRGTYGGRVLYRLKFLQIETLAGDMRADVGDYIIKGVNGEFYPCKADIFAKTYEASS